MADSLTQQTISKPGVYPQYVSNVQDQTVDKRFGVVSGTPQTVSLAGDTTIYTPAAGHRVRLKWVGLSSPSTNTATVIATVKWSDGTLIYIWDLGAPGAFAHSSVREGAVDASLVVTLSGSQTIRFNLDVEEFT
jgi:hypothetical protein